MRSLDEAEVLALRAALQPREEAALAWNTLTEALDWMNLPDRVQRCMPAIAVNLGCHSPRHLYPATQIRHAARLAGVYRATWTSNIIRIRAFAPLLDAFDRITVDYRVLKGTAICAMTDHWGIRRMADMDIAIPANRVEDCFGILYAIGFAPRFFQRIDERDPPSAVSWVDPFGHPVDIHIGGSRSQRGRLISMILEGPTSYVTSQGRLWPIPTPSAMAIHVAVHARAESAESDHVQSLLDLHLLLTHAKGPEFGEDARSCRTRGTMSQLRYELSMLQAVEHAEEPRRHPLERALQAFDDMMAFPTHVRHQLRGRRYRVAKDDSIQLRWLLYAIWTNAGALRQTEHLVMVLFGGFLRSGTLETPRDRRQRVLVPPHLRGKSIRLSVKASDETEHLLYIDGIYFGSHLRQSNHLFNSAPTSFEVSLRLLGDPRSRHLGAISVFVSPAEQSKPETDAVAN